jgi:hydroxyacylglutathione hydrolase
MTTQVHSLNLGIAHVYLVETGQGLYLVDTGGPGMAGRILHHMQTLRRLDLRLIFITHAHMDHYGSAAELRRRTGAPLAIHRLDAEAMAHGETHVGSARGRGHIGKLFLPLADRLLPAEPTQPDLLLEDGQSLEAYGLDASVIHSPGHTPGSACLFVESRLAFVGDLISAGLHPHVQSFYAQDWSLLPASLRRVQILSPEWVYTGHGFRPLDGEAFQLLARRYLSAHEV